MLLVGTLSAETPLTKAPGFSSDAVWIDSNTAGANFPHSIKGYRGRVLLIDFWEYTCINCIRDFAVLKRWYAKYHQYGFDIVGVHYGEFAIGYKVENVREAARRFRLPWPVVADLRGSIWNAYHSDVWPNRFLVDQNGDIVMHLRGEGNDHSMEEKIQDLLAAAHPEVRKVPLDPAEDTFAPQCGVTTEETYVGRFFGRGDVADLQEQRGTSITDFHAQKQPDDGQVVLDGKWVTEHEGAISAGKQDKAELRYHARSVYAVMSIENTKKPVRLNVLQDGKALTRDEAGADVQFDANGAYVEVSDPRMYDLVKNLAFSSHLLTLEPQGDGLALHSFTYGNNCQQDFDRK